MSTLKVNNIQSFTAADPVIINDFLEVKGNVSASNSITSSKFQVQSLAGTNTLSATGVQATTGSFSRIKLGTAVPTNFSDGDLITSGIVSSSSSGSFMYVKSAGKTRTEAFQAGTNHSSTNINPIGSLFTTASTDRLLVIAENLPRMSVLTGTGLPEGALFTVSGSQLPFSGSSAELDAVSSSLFVMIRKP
tara:strand:+ start:277 stop:849 length:573 start_codon:yes stop_codon:yes gene_type:complete